MTPRPFEGLEEWERADFIAPSDDGLPDWLRELRAKHLSALDEFQKSIANVADTTTSVEASNRAHRRAVRDAIAAGEEPPSREHGNEVGTAQVQVGQEDALFARYELAEVTCEVLAAIRERREDFTEHFFNASEPLRRALFKGPDGMTEDDRARKARAGEIAREPSMVDVDDPQQSQFARLGKQEVHSANA